MALKFSVADMGVAEPEKIWFGVKGHSAEADAQSVLFIDKATGLRYLNRRAPLPTETATITWIDATHVRIDVPALVMATLFVGNFLYDVQVSAQDNVVTVANGAFTVAGDIVQEV